MISVIVPAYNSEKTIAKTLEAIQNQNYPKNKHEIIVVDDGSTDNTEEIVSKFRRVKLISVKHDGPARARNIGVKKSKGEIVLFTDADCIPNKNWIKNTIQPLKDKNVVGISGTYKTLNKNSLIARFVGYEIEERHEQLQKQKYIDFIGTFSAAYRKKIFLNFGGFDERFPIASGEDPELSFKIDKAGYKMVFQPNAFVYHNHPDTIIKLMKQKFWRGYWRILLYKKHKDKIFRHSYTPNYLYAEIFFLIFGFVLFSLSLFNIFFINYAILSFLLFFILSLKLSIKIFKKDIVLGFLSPFIIFFRDLSTALGIISGFMFLKKK